MVLLGNQQRVYKTIHVQFCEQTCFGREPSSRSANPKSKASSADSSIKSHSMHEDDKRPRTELAPGQPSTGHNSLQEAALYNPSDL